MNTGEKRGDSCSEMAGKKRSQIAQRTLFSTNIAGPNCLTLEVMPGCAAIFTASTKLYVVLAGNYNLDRLGKEVARRAYRDVEGGRKPDVSGKEGSFCSDEMRLSNRNRGQGIQNSKFG